MVHLGRWPCGRRDASGLARVPVLDLAGECTGNKSHILYTVFEILSIFFYAEVCSVDSDCTSATNGANKVCTSGICVCGSDYVLGDDGACVQSKIRSKNLCMCLFEWVCVCVCLYVCVFVLVCVSMCVCLSL